MFTLTQVLTTLCVGYIAYSMWSLTSMFFPPPCQSDETCIRSYLEQGFTMKMHLFTSTSAKEGGGRELWSNLTLDSREPFLKDFNVTLPRKTKNNGTLYLHAYACILHFTPQSDGCTHSVEPITAHAVTQRVAFNLIGGQKNETEDDQVQHDLPVTHWYPKVVLNVMTELSRMDGKKYIEIFRLIRLVPSQVRGLKGHHYLPIITINKMHFKRKELQPIPKDSKRMAVKIEYKPIGVGLLRFFTIIEESLKQMRTFGFTDKDLDELKGMLTDINVYFLVMTFAVSAFHILFDVLAFKNDISFWKKRKTMVGVSSRTVTWRCISTAIIFLYLLDQNTSLLVLIPCGISALIEVWKVKKALKISIYWNGMIPKVQFGDSSKKELETEEFDAKAMRYLSYLLYPLCLCGAVYSLFYVSHRSWYSWCVQSLVNGVYAFGFLFMLPQLFVNYKLKSVAHLPWRAFMYKAFNTFIDDVFAFIITMPTAHRLACFRDDVIFMVYLYQRWLYPVDKKRVNEFGQSFDDDGSDEPQGKPDSVGDSDDSVGDSDDSIGDSGEQQDKPDSAGDHGEQQDKPDLAGDSLETKKDK